LVEKLVVELKRVKKDNPNVSFNLDEDVSLIFFTEFYDKNLPVSGEFAKNLK
jgi:hypothetical protein